jgi:hypothetical protein
MNNNGFLYIIIPLLIIVIILYFTRFSSIYNEDFKNWKNERFFKNRELPINNKNQNRLVATAPIHEKDDIEHFFGSKWFFGDTGTKKKEDINTEEDNKKVNNNPSFPDFNNKYKPRPTNNLPKLNNKILMPANGINNYNNNNLLDNQFNKKIDINTIAKPINEIPVLNKAPQNNGPSILKENCFKFFNDTQNVDKNKFMFTGAEMGINSSSDVNLNCNGDIISETAKAIANVENGKITEIYLIDKGKGYNKNPNIKIVSSEGYGCKAEAIVNDNGSIELIRIIDEGEGYTSTPKIIIEEPNKIKKCRLYFKKDCL